MRRFVLLALVAWSALGPIGDAGAFEIPRATVHYEEHCPFYPDGGTCAKLETGEVWLQPGANRFALWHEFGHLFDYRVLTDADRAWLMPLLGFEPGPWNQGMGPGTHGPSEVFADAYATCATRKQSRVRSPWMSSEHETAYGWAPTPRQMVRVCNAIALAERLREPVGG